MHKGFFELQPYQTSKANAPSTVLHSQVTDTHTSVYAPQNLLVHEEGSKCYLILNEKHMLTRQQIGLYYYYLSMNTIYQLPHMLHYYSGYYGLQLPVSNTDRIYSSTPFFNEPLIVNTLLALVIGFTLMVNTFLMVEFIYIFWHYASIMTIYVVNKIIGVSSSSDASASASSSTSNNGDDDTTHFIGDTTSPAVPTHTPNTLEMNTPASNSVRYTTKTSVNARTRPRSSIHTPASPPFSRLYSSDITLIRTDPSPHTINNTSNPNTH